MNKSVSQATYILVSEERLVSKCRRDEGGGVSQMAGKKKILRSFSMIHGYQGSATMNRHFYIKK